MMDLAGIEDGAGWALNLGLRRNVLLETTGSVSMAVSASSGSLSISVKLCTS